MLKPFDPHKACMISTVAKACKGQVNDPDAIDALLYGGYSAAEIRENLDDVLASARTAALQVAA